MVSYSSFSLSSLFNIQRLLSWWHGNWTRGARFMIREKSHCTLLPLDSRNQESVKIPGFWNPMVKRCSGIFLWSEFNSQWSVTIMLWDSGSTWKGGQIRGRGCCGCWSDGRKRYQGSSTWEFITPKGGESHSRSFMTDKRGGVRMVRLMYCCNVVINRDPPRISTSLSNLWWEVVGHMVQRRSSWWCHRTVGWYRESSWTVQRFPKQGQKVEGCLL
jgi:hypothetical protein